LLHRLVRLERGTNLLSNQRTKLSQRPKWSLEKTHVNRLKPYHEDSKFQTFTDNFQKQGGDEDFDFPPNEEEKIEIKNPEKLVKRK
jgi:hypothetical protein